MLTSGRKSLAAIALLAGVVGAVAWFTATQPAPVRADIVTMYKSPACGCCSKWADHLRQRGYEVQTLEVRDLERVKIANGVPLGLASCHTALIEGYVIEGHVPVADIDRLLRERPAFAGLAVPGMPIGSPGMEGPNPEPYDVLSFDATGPLSVFASHGPGIVPKVQRGAP